MTRLKNTCTTTKKGKHMTKKLDANDIKKIIENLKTAKNIIKDIPHSKIDIEIENRTADTINISDFLVEAESSINDIIDKLHAIISDIYINAVDERERYPENSMHPKALWLDEVQLTADVLRTHAHNASG